MNKRYTVIAMTFFLIITISSCKENKSHQAETLSGEDLAKGIQSIVLDTASSKNELPRITVTRFFSNEECILQDELDIEQFYNWLNSLELELHIYEQGQSPGDGNGGTGYEFSAGCDKDFLFVYRPGVILYSGDWYQVHNQDYPFWREFDPSCEGEID